MADLNVHPDTLEAYARGLGDRAGRVQAAADRIGAVNGGDINAFGVAVGQVLGIPTRIALGILRDQVSSAAQSYTTQVDTVRTAASHYRANEGNVTQSFSGIL